MSNKIKIPWSNRPDKKDYAAAKEYLTLLFEPKFAANLVRLLRQAPVTHYVARDILRAAGVSLLGVSASDRERKRIKAGNKIAPLLLVRDQSVGRVIVADGYHRLCTVYTIDKQATIPCKIV